MNGISSIFLWVFVVWSGLSNAFSAEPELILNGRMDSSGNSFKYFLLRDQNGQPILSRSNHAIYEGIRPSSSRNIAPVHVLSSLKSLLENGYIEQARQPEESTPWVKDIASIRVDFRAVEEAFESLSKDSKPLLDFFTNSPSLKAEIFEKLLLGDSLELDYRKLKAFKIGATYPNPEPIRFPIRVPVSAFLRGISFPDRVEKSLDYVWGKVADTYFDIHVAKLNLAFQKKSILFNASDQSLDIEVDLKGADLSGMIHGIGRVKNISNCFDLIDNKDPRKYWLNPNFWSQKSVLVGAEIGGAKVRFSLKFELDDDGFWKIKMSKPLRLSFPASSNPSGSASKPKVIIKMVAPEHVQIEDDQFIYDEKYVERVESNLDQAAIQRIEKTLSMPFDAALKNAIQPDDLGIQIPIRGWPGEREQGEAKLQIRLGDIKWMKDHFALRFDGRMHFFKRAGCMKSIPLSDANWESSQSGVGPIDRGNRNSDGREFAVFESSDMHQFKWKFLNLDSVNPGVQILIPKHGLQFLVQSAAFSGLYCLSSRALWPRPGYFPLIEFSPARLPNLSLEKDKLTAQFSAAVTFFERDQKGTRERFIPKDPMNIEMELPLVHDSAKKELAWSLPSRVKVAGWNQEETDAFDRLLHLGLRLFQSDASGVNDKSAIVPLNFSYQVLSKFLNIGEPGVAANLQPVLKNLAIDGLGLSVDLDLGDNNHTPSGVRPKGAIIEGKPPRTILVDAPPKHTREPFLTVRWKVDPENPLFYSWRMKSHADRTWPDWKPFEARDYLLAAFEKPGRYEFQLKSMNRAFEIEEMPVVFETYFEPDISVALKPKKDGAQVLPSEPSSSPVAGSSPAPNRIGAKGMFGCSVGIGQSLDASNLFTFLAFISCLMILRSVLRTRLKFRNTLRHPD